MVQSASMNATGALESRLQDLRGQRAAAVAFEWHNYGKSTIGTRSDIEKVPVDSLRRFYKKYYQPDNAVVIVAGRFIAYNWFDCDIQPQSDFVNWFAGCVVPPASN